MKQSKAKFDKKKLDCLQKVDLLAASRCNMFSHALIMYQNALILFWEKTAKTMTHVNDSFQVSPMCLGTQIWVLCSRDLD